MSTEPGPFELHENAEQRVAELREAVEQLVALNKEFLFLSVERKRKDKTVSKNELTRRIRDLTRASADFHRKVKARWSPPSLFTRFHNAISRMVGAK